MAWQNILVDQQHQDTLEVANATLGALRGRIAKELGLIDNAKSYVSTVQLLTAAFSF